MLAPVHRCQICVSDQTGLQAADVRADIFNILSRNVSTEDLCPVKTRVHHYAHTLHVAFVVMGFRDTTLIDAALRSMLYFRSCPLHLHVIVDAATADIDWSWLQSHVLVTLSLHLTEFAPEKTLQPETFRRWGTGNADGIEYAWPREALPSRFAKLSMDTIIPDNVDRVLFMDNDVVLLDDVCKAQSVFDDMPASAIFGMSPQMSDLYTKVAAPFAYPVTPAQTWRAHPGVNSGTIFWQLDAARSQRWSLDLVWLKMLEEGIKLYNFGLLDQDIFNYFGWQHPHLLWVSQSTSRLLIQMHTVPLHGFMHACVLNSSKAANCARLEQSSYVALLATSLRLCVSQCLH